MMSPSIPLGNVTHLEPDSGRRRAAMTTTTTGGPTPSRSSTSCGGHVTRSLRRGDAVYAFSDNFVAKGLASGRSLGTAPLAVNATAAEYDDDAAAGAGSV